MPSKLGLHIISPSPDVDKLIQSAPWAAVKAVDSVQPLETARNAGIANRILRLYGIESLTPADAVARFLSVGDLGVVNGLELANESPVGLDPAWQGAVVAGLRAAGYAGNVFIGGFSTGTPTVYDVHTHADGSPHFPDLLPLMPLLRQYGVCLGVNAYSGVLASDPRFAQWAPWTVWRHRLLLHCCHQHGADPDCAVLESGGDNVAPVTQGGGWLSRGWSPADYLALLTAMDAGDRQDTALLCRCVFTSAPTQDWRSYDVAPVAPALAAYVNQQATAPTKGPTVFGVDLSNVNGAVDMAQVATVARFAALKLSEGVGWRDPTFTANWQAAKAAGLVAAAYHFARPDLQNTPEAEAAYFVSQLPPLDTGDCLALDLEVGTGDLSGWALRWLQAVHAAVGFAPWLYSYPDFITTRSLGTVALAAYPLWYASYQASEPAPPGQWRRIAVWQETDAATVPGAALPVDGDVTALTVDQLRALGKPALVQQGGTVTPDEQEALDYYQQLGVRVDPSHAIWTEALRPLYALWKSVSGQASPPISPDLVKPGPLVLPEYGTLFGGNRPAACVKLSNRIVGVYEGADGHWTNPYQANI